MIKTWRLINSGPQDPATNMATDEALLLDYRPGVSAPTLRLYEWQPASFSIGLSQDPEKLLFSDSAVRRPTGGGLLWHDDEVTYSFVADTQDLDLPKHVKESYACVTAFILKTLEILGLQTNFAKDAGTPRGPLGPTPQGPVDFCFSRHEEYDVCVNGKKIGGHAQKRRRRTFLQHGSLPLTLDRSRLLAACRGLTPTDFEGVTSLTESAGRAFSREEVHQALTGAFVRHFGVWLRQEGLSQKETRRMEGLRADKYAQPAWNQKRHDDAFLRAAAPAGVAA